MIKHTRKAIAEALRNKQEPNVYLQRQDIKLRIVNVRTVRGRVQVKDLNSGSWLGVEESDQIYSMR